LPSASSLSIWSSSVPRALATAFPSKTAESCSGSTNVVNPVILPDGSMIASSPISHPYARAASLFSSTSSHPSIGCSCKNGSTADQRSAAIQTNCTGLSANFAMRSFHRPIACALAVTLGRNCRTVHRPAKLGWYFAGRGRTHDPGPIDIGSMIAGLYRNHIVAERSPQGNNEKI
jgi:hypothetical protein